jgi:outer membrane protein assembly factor BamA
MIGFLFIIGCNPTKYVPSERYLLNRVKIQIDNKSISKQELKSYIRQKPNKRVLGLRFYLGMYNLSNINKKTGINKYLQKEGEPPAIWDQFATKRDIKQLKLYLSKKGYYYSIVKDTVIFRKRKVDIRYSIKVNQPYIIRSYKYAFEDTAIQHTILADTLNSLIKIGNLLDDDVLSNERVRIENIMKNNGYYVFNREAVSYEVDSIFSLMKVDLIVNIKNRIRVVNNQITSVPYKQYKIDKVTVITEPGILQKESINYHQDSMMYNGIQYINWKKSWIRSEALTQSIYTEPDAPYRISNVEETKSHLFSLNVYNTPNIQFIRHPRNDTSNYNYLDCLIRLSLLDSIQSFGSEVDGTYSSGNLGGALNLIYQHKSLFKNAENFSLKLRGALEAVRRTDMPQFHYALEYGAEATLNIPKFLIPFNSIKFKKKYNPKTAFTAAYNYNHRPDYTQAMANISFGYNWKVEPYVTHQLKPVSINLVNYSHVDTIYYDQYIKGKSIENIYINHVVSALNYSFIFKNQNPKKNTDFHYFRWNFESSGNLLTLFGYDSLFNVRVSQYVLTDIDYHYFHVVNDASNIVYRIYAGIGYPYGNSVTLPYEKQFFAGGANSIRGWQALTLGPGSYVNRSSKYPNSTGDLKLEANMEYRFKLPWVLEGAMFVDAGNIWAITPQDKRPGALFEWNKFYKDLAIGTGVGLRFNFHYFLFRVDVGMKTRNPASDASNPWIFNQHKLYFTSQKGKPSDFAISFTINYPF